MATSRETRTWQLQDAKNRFSHVVDQAQRQGPQIVTRRGRETAVVLSYADYLALIGRRTPERSFADFLLAAPKIAGGLVVERSRDTGRKVDLE